ncbi:unnamed protein product [Didymodactylos carnosus]|uniref:CSN8/PSMD8/EIF3K domain-containing protein n=1 Tax=Didymodactylos carnosus TaxID=1234261 RepID=A0A8S2RUG1_9BILA|nr:unnamed protein product [Didymodactylos carnosus]CAF4184472.1 unnamed protein product [Didymodactylos carnosus]
MANLPADAKVLEALPLYEKLKNEWNRKPPNIEKCDELLRSLKNLFAEGGFYPSDISKDTRGLLIARDTLEIGAQCAVTMGDIPAFERSLAQLKPFYFDLGFCLFLLEELELLPPKDIQNNLYLKHPVSLEQYLMEGSYNKVFLAKGYVPSPSSNFFMEILLNTIRDEIAYCMEKSYRRIPFNEAGKILSLSNTDELNRIAQKIMDFNFSHKVTEAEEHVRQAEKYLKTSLTNWKPDLDSAINELEKAMSCYRIANSYDKCLEISLRNAELQLKKESKFFAAKSYEQAATCAQQMNDLPQSAKYFDKAAQLLIEGGQRDSAVILYERIGSVFQNFDRLLAIDFYVKGARIAEVDDKTHQASELYEKAALQSIRQSQNFTQTSELLEKCSHILVKMERYDRLNRILLYRILIKLFMDDFVAANNLFERFCQEYPTFAEWEEAQNIQMLIEAFEQDDPDLISQNCQRPFFLAIDNEFVRLLKRWIRPTATKRPQNGAAVESSSSGGNHSGISQTTTISTVKPLQLDEDDLR